jgi:hypothetical protein
MSDFLADHLARSNQLNMLHLQKQTIPEFDPKVAAIIVKLQAKPDLIVKVEQFLAGLEPGYTKPEDTMS